MSASIVQLEQRFCMSAVPWTGYLRLGKVFAGRHVRITYDRGELEIVTLSSEHQCYKRLLGRLIETLTEELNLPLAGFGSTTFKRRKGLKGLEPDECFWIANEPQVHGKVNIDLKRDPPPDLVVEINITKSSLNRLAIYATLGVPEIWRFDGAMLYFHVLQAGCAYEVVAASRSFPKLTTADLLPYVALRSQTDENNVIRQFRESLKQPT